MQAIETSFTERGFSYEQVARNGMVALYRQTRIHSGVVRYEVVLLTRHQDHVWPDGRRMPAHEGYPPASAWGRRGWTFLGLQDAQAWMEGLVAAQTPARGEDPL
jgi:hypothetical protein